VLQLLLASLYDIVLLMQYRVGDLLSKFGGTKMGVLECVEVLDELAKSEGFAAQSHAGLEALELAS
jgi:hypothetical protein